MSTVLYLQKSQNNIVGSGVTYSAIPFRSLVPGGGRPSASSSGTTKPELSKIVKPPARDETGAYLQQGFSGTCRALLVQIDDFGCVYHRVREATLNLLHVKKTRRRGKGERLTLALLTMQASSMS
jgi:hypothetical protein